MKQGDILKPGYTSFRFIRDGRNIRRVLLIA